MAISSVREPYLPWCLFPQPSALLLTRTVITTSAWEKIPSRLRSKFSNSTLLSLNQFPPDWPEVEYLSQQGDRGYQQNYILDAPKDNYNYASVATALIAPLSRGTVTISSPNMAVPPVINPNWLTHPADQAVAVAGYKRVREMFNTSVMQPVLIGGEYFPGEEYSTDEQILSIIRQTMNTVYHAASTCAMGKVNDTMAVVDSRARVIGVQRLRVVDASAFPFLPPGHPMATVCEFSYLYIV